MRLFAGETEEKSRVDEQVDRRMKRTPTVTSVLLSVVTLFGVASVPACSADSGAHGANVLFVVVDTLRADHVGAYSGVDTTPNLDAFSRQAVVFLDANSQGSNTINSAPSLLTSSYPSEHGYTNYKLAISDEHVSLAEVLGSHDYETFAVSTNPHVTARNGLAQGFESFLDHPTWTDTAAPAVNRLFLDWLDGRDGDRPFFALLWYVDPHVPYTPPDAILEELLDPQERALVSERTIRPGFEDLSAEEKAVSKRLYQGEVHSFDRAFGELLRQLRQREALEDTLVVFTSDHGESFWEHDGVDGRPVVGHGISLYRTETAVPLVMRFPDGRFAGSEKGRVDTIDIVPTVLDALGAEVRGNRFQGRNLMPLIRGEVESSQEPPSVTELRTDFNGTLNIHMESIRTAAGKLVLTHRYRGADFDPPHLQLLDGRDQELRAASEDASAATREALLAALERWRSTLLILPPEPVGEWAREQELVERLRALGYLR